MSDAAYRISIADAEYWREMIKCQYACPVHTDARGYVRAIAEGDYERAYLIARGPNPLASLCGRICGAPCEAACRRGTIDQPIAIRALKRFACEQYGLETRLDHPDEQFPGLRRAPPCATATTRTSCCTCSPSSPGASSRSPPGAGGDHRLRPGRPGRGTRPGPDGLPSDDLRDGVRAGRHAGHRGARVPVAARPDPRRGGGDPRARRGDPVQHPVGRDIPFETLRREFAAVMIACGAKGSRALPIPGVDAIGVMGGVDFLRDVALGKKVELGRRVIVIGGGNVAYDVARTVLRQVEYDVARTAARIRECARSASSVWSRSRKCRPTRWRSSKAPKRASRDTTAGGRRRS